MHCKAIMHNSIIIVYFNLLELHGKENCQYLIMDFLLFVIAIGSIS